jgi:membrane-associated protein
MFDIEHIIQSGGILIISLIVFAESGLLVGFFLPGDTLLFTAGFFASQGKLPIVWLVTCIVLAAIIGDNVGYAIGRRTGHRIFRKKDGIVFRHDHIARANAFYKQHGGKTIIIARFVPIVRTFAPMLAGVGDMPRRKFFVYNVVGGVLWGAGVTLLGYFLGNTVPNIEAYIIPVMLLAIVATFAPTLHHALKDKRIRAALIDWLKKWWKRITLQS